VLLLVASAVYSISDDQVEESLVAGNHGNKDKDKKHKDNNGVRDQDKTESGDNTGQGSATRIRLTFDEALQVLSIDLADANERHLRWAHRRTTLQAITSEQ